MTSFDLILVIVLLVSCGLAIVRGAVLEIATLIILGISWLLAVQFSPALLALSSKGNSMVALLVSYAVIMSISFLALYIACHILLSRFALTGRAVTVNRVVGGLFGFARGYFLIGLGFLAYGYYLDEAHQHDSVRNGALLPMAQAGAEFFEQFIPDSAKLDQDAERNNTHSPSTKTPLDNATQDGYGRADRAGLSEVITTVTTNDPDEQSETPDEEPDF